MADIQHNKKVKMEKIPEHARCVFKGLSFAVWQWDQVEFDGNTKVYEVVERFLPTLWAIAIVDGKILINQEEQAHMPGHLFLSLSGGTGEEGETPLEGAKRELAEEVGYTSEDWVPWKEEHTTGKIFWSTYGFIARNAKKTQDTHLDGGERITPILLSVDEFFDLDKREDIRGDMLLGFLKECRRDPSKKDEFIKLIFNT